MEEMKLRTYSELSEFKTFEERLSYLELHDRIGEETFGFDRYINQIFYKTPEWIAVRDIVIIRDSGCDLGVPGFEIVGEPIIIHHINPIRKEDLMYRRDWILDPEFLIATRSSTHRAIHYGIDDYLILSRVPVVRTKNDTSPWRK